MATVGQDSEVLLGIVDTEDHLYYKHIESPENNTCRWKP